MAKHTPGPWKVSDRGHAAVSDVRERPIASCGGYTTNTDDGEHFDENIANAAFIVRACNAHDDLLAALRIIADWPITDPANQDAANMALIAKRAIAKATGTPS